MPKLTIDGVEIEAREGQTVLQAALEHGIHIPHLCYHPRLRVAGNCRMCLVELEKVPKLQIACGTEVHDGLVVHTKSEKVNRARRAVLEFLLLNHPLDCPVCDQCGECKVQDYCFEYGRAESRYQEQKRTYPRMAVGPHIVRDMNRCIHCTRCVRFLRDVAGSEEFTLYERGGHTQVGPYLERPIESPFSLNLAEVCPVGALTSRHFRFRGRSWLMLRIRTLCAGCSRGCNAYAWASKDRLLRLTPAENPQVNLCWLCDPGRLTTDRVHAPDRVIQPVRDGQKLERETALEAAATKLRALMETGDTERIGVVASARLTNEDLYLVRKLAREVLGTDRIAFAPGPDDHRPFGPTSEPLPNWFIRKDPAPNSRGARDILGSTHHERSLPDLIDAAASGEVRALLVFCEDLGDGQGIPDALEKLDFVLVADSHWTRTARRAHLVLPEASFAEKDGTFTNEAGRVQRLRAAIGYVGESRPAWQTAQELARRLGAGWTFQSPAEVMEEIAAKVPGYQEISYQALSMDGLLVGQAETNEGDADA